MTLILSGTSGLSDVDGSAATPAIRGTDANTGMFFPAADTIAFSEGGVESVRIDASGNVGIGTVSPIAKLNVTGAAVTNADARSLIFATDTSAFAAGVGGGISFLAKYNTAGTYFEAGNVKGIKENGTDGNFAGALAFTTHADGGSPTERMRINSSGNVGIGTTAPNAKLELSLVSNPGGPGFYGGANNLLLFAASGSGYGEPAVKFQEHGTDVGAVIAGKNTANGAMAIVFANRSTSSTTSTLTEKMRIDQDGNLLVGTTVLAPTTTAGSIILANGVAQFTANSTEALDVVRIGTTGAMAAFFYGATNVGTITTSGTTTAYNTSSDYRLKENVAPMTGALATVAQLKPVTYTWKADGSAGQGFIAHELQAVVPDCVTGTKDAVDAEGKPRYQGVDTSFLVATVVAALQELKAEVDSLKAQLQGAA